MRSLITFGEQLANKFTIELEMPSIKLTGAPAIFQIPTSITLYFKNEIHHYPSIADRTQLIKDQTAKLAFDKVPDTWDDTKPLMTIVTIGQTPQYTTKLSFLVTTEGFPVIGQYIPLYYTLAPQFFPPISNLYNPREWLSKQEIKNFCIHLSTPGSVSTNILKKSSIKLLPFALSTNLDEHEHYTRFLTDWF